MDQPGFGFDKGYRFSVIIPNKGEQKPLARSVDSILNTRNFQSFEIIVINDGGSKDVKEYLAKLRDAGVAVQEICNSQRLGSYGARNQGIKKAKGEWLLFCDDDLKIPDDWLQKVEPCLPSSDFICCNIQVEQVNNEILAYAYSRAHGFQAKAKFEQSRFGLTTFLLVHHKVFSQVGFFDERIYAGGDYIFSRKVATSNFKQKFLEDLVIHHQPKNWKKQFLTLCRINKGKVDRAKYYPGIFGNKGLSGKDLLRTIKYLAQNLINYQETTFYQETGVNWWRHQKGQLIYYTLYFCSQVLVLLFPNKRFNW